MDIEKIYYTIGQVSEITELPQSVLRYWETVFEQLNPDKSGGGTRHYSKTDVDTILKIKRLLYNEGFTIKGARKRLSDKESGTELTHAEIKETHISSEKYDEDAIKGKETESGGQSRQKATPDYQAIIDKLKQIVKIIDA